MQTLKITLSEEDCNDIRSGETMDWTWKTEEGEEVQLIIGLGSCCNECGDEHLDGELTCDDEDGCYKCSKCK